MSGKFRLVTSSSTEFVSIPSGRSGLTPFYRALHYTSDRGILDIFFGRRGNTGVDFPKKRLELAYGDNIALSPYDKQLFDRMQ